MRHARSALTCALFSSIMSSRATEDTGTSSAHRYKDYRTYEGHMVTNYYIRTEVRSAEKVASYDPCCVGHCSCASQSRLHGRAASGRSF